MAPTNSSRFLPALLVLLLLLAPLSTARAGEEILHFDSIVEVEADGALKVTEYILVQVEGEEIIHGIYRDFPLRFQRADGGIGQVGFKVLQVLRDDQPENWFTRRQDGFIRIYAGSRNVLLSQGIHEYIFIYRTSRQLRYLPEHDELYWNVTGEHWKFPIRKARITVHLPQGAKAEKVALFTGTFNAREANATILQDSAGLLKAETTAPLAPGEGFSIAIALPRGTLPRPAYWQRWWFWLQDNMAMVAIVGGAIAINIYFLWSWWLVGRDPRPGPIAPRWEPPRNLSPAQALWVHRTAFALPEPNNSHLLSVALTSLAVNGYLKMDMLPDGTLEITKLKDPGSDLSEEERMLMKLLFDKENIFSFSRHNQDALEGLLLLLGKKVAQKGRTLLKENSLWFMGGLFILAMFGLLLLASFMLDLPHAGVVLLTTVIMLIPAGIIFAMVKHSDRKTATRNMMSFMGAALMPALIRMVPIFALLVALYAFSPSLPSVSMSGFTERIPLQTVFIIAASVLAITVSLLVWQFLLKRPTVRARKMLDELEGLKMFIATTERGKLEKSGDFNMSVQLFEKLLPWAMALGLEKAWTQTFSSWYEATAVSDIGADNIYTPRWYFSGTPHSNIANISNIIDESIGNALPSETSSAFGGGGGGGAGGGGVGGGGGGGGGGGW